MVLAEVRQIQTPLGEPTEGAKSATPCPCSPVTVGRQVLNLLNLFRYFVGHALDYLITYVLHGFVFFMNAASASHQIQE